MAEYKLGPRGTIIRTADGHTIPSDLGNQDRQWYEAWLAAGGVPDPADPVPIDFTARVGVSRVATTVGTTAQEIFRETLVPQAGYAGLLQLIGVDRASFATRIYQVSIGVGRGNAGAVGIGSPAVVVYAPHIGTGTTNWGGPVATVSVNDAIITVTGLVNRTIDWSLTGQLVRFTPGVPA